MDVLQEEIARNISQSQRNLCEHLFLAGLMLLCKWYIVNCLMDRCFTEDLNSGLLYKQIPEALWEFRDIRHGTI